MNGLWTPRAWKGALTAIAVLGCATLAAQPLEEAADPSPGESKTAEDVAPPPQRLRQIVSVGEDATVLPGQVSEGVVVVHGNARIDGDVHGDVVVVLGKLKMSGRIRGDLVVVLGEADVNGAVTGDTAMIFTHASVGPKADLRHDLVAVGHPIRIDPAARIHGHPEIIALGPVARYMDWGKDYLIHGVFLLRPFPPHLFWVWVFAAFFLIFHAGIAGIFAGPVRNCVNILRDQPARSFMVGLLACVLIGPVSLLLSFTILAPLLIWLAFLALCTFGRVAAYAAAGSAIGRGTGMELLARPVPAVVVGSILFYLCYMVPLLGFLLYWLVLPWGVGAALLLMTENIRRERRPTGPAGFANAAGYRGVAAAGSLATGGPAPATQAIVGNPGTPPDVSAPSTLTSAPTPPPSEPPPVGPAPILSLSNMDRLALPRAGFWMRLGAAAIDLVLIAFIAGILAGEVRAFWILAGIYHWVMWAWKGTTLGGSILGLQLIRMDGRPVDWSTAGVRVLGSLVSLLALGLGFFWVAWDDQYQSWHDRIAGTTIVKLDRHAPLV